MRAEAISSRYEVGVYGADGRLVRTLRRTVPPVRLSAREVKAGETELNDEVRFHKLTRSAIPFGIPTNKPPITTLSWSLDGALWVQRSTADGRPSESDVYDASGKWIAIAEWPSSIGLAAGRYLMSGKTMLATTRDSSDVESVVRLRFR
ncbi:MAG: hypothetical protein ABIW79_08440 [Gemmatimonas sp.]